MPKVYRQALQTYIDRCAAAGAFQKLNHHLSLSQDSDTRTSLPQREDNTANMRTSMIYPNIITSLPPEPAPLPDLSRLKIRDHDDDRRSRKRSRSRRRSRSRSRRRHRGDDDYYYHHRSARSTPMHSPRKDVRFFDESPPPRSRRSVVPDRPKSYVRDAPPIALGESAKDTARRLYSDHRAARHYRDESGSSASVSGSRAGSRANSPAGLRRPHPDPLKMRRPGLDRGYSANDVRRADLAMTSNVANAGSDMLAPIAEMRPGHKRWHSKG